MRACLAATLALLAGCSGDGGTQDGGGTTAVTDPFQSFVNMGEDVQASGDFSCFTPGTDHATGAWLSQGIDTTLQEVYTVDGLVEDFEKGDPVAGATVALWYADSVGGTPDVTADSDQNGAITIDAPACQKMTYRVTAEGGPEPTKTTYKAHHIYPAPTGGVIEDGYFLSVSEVTYQLIPGILGVTVDPDKAIIAGTAYDCGRDPSWPTDDDTGKIEGVQVVVYDENGEIPDTLQVNYFTESFPDRNQEHTSPDGLWVASNVPPGELRVEMWGRVGGEPVLLGATVLQSEADSINIANVFAGYGDGVKYPTSCESM